LWKDIQEWHELIYREIGKRIQKAREEAGLSQEELASALGITQSALSNYELGKRRLYLANLEQLANVLERPLSYFMEEESSKGEGAELEQKSSDGVTSEIVRLLAELNEEERVELLDYIKWRRDRLK